MKLNGHGEVIPAEVFVPIMRRYIGEYQSLIGAEPGQREERNSINFAAGPREAADRWSTTDASRFCSAVNVLADEVGLTPSTIRKYLEGKRQWMPFYTADRLLCAMNMVHLWLSPPLVDYYMPSDVLAAA